MNYHPRPIEVQHEPAFDADLYQLRLGDSRPVTVDLSAQETHDLTVELLRATGLWEAAIPEGEDD